MPLTLDPQLGAALFALSGGQPLPPPPPVGDVMTRRNDPNYRNILLSSHAKSEDVGIKELSTPTADGHEIHLRWYTKAGSTETSAVYYMHGGGLIFGEAAWFDHVLSNYVSDSGVPFLSVEYRLAPEHPHPIPLEDAYIGLQWLHDHASELGVDPDKIAVMGDSGGGGLAAALAIHSRDKGGPKIAKQILVYPMLDDRTVTKQPHIAPFAIWSHEDSLTAWNARLGESRDNVPANAAPARVEDVEGLPAAYIDVGNLDIFVHEDIAYAAKLSAAGIPVDLHVFSGAIHCFELFAPQSDIAKFAKAARVKAIKSICI